MLRILRLLALALVVLVAVSSAATAAETAEGAIRGTVTDGSGGALPGVTVTATSMDGRAIATTVTDAAGAYALAALPVGPVRLTFQLDGFAAAGASVAVPPDGVSIVGKQLELAPVTETVVVVGKATDSAPPSHALPAPVVTPVPVHDRDSVCGPAKPTGTLESFGTIASRREAARELYATDDELIVDGGTLDGLEVGQNVVVRRLFRTTDAAGAIVTGEHTAGLIQVVAAHAHASTAVVVYACDELRKGDFLAAFKPEPLRTPDPVGIPAYDSAARILYADAGQMLGAPRRLMVIDRGSDQGIHVGQRLTLFRRRRGATKPSVIGDAVVVAIRLDSATIRVEGVSDAIVPGDWAAPQQQARAGSTVTAGAGKLR
ncbi:MAG TPA: carboxypeptidase-like regulatory domain-containing protein [Vicinamibacterales bacterium]|nr:carboxypeptidase-like regulatory domain-containing protein [Vicinamibacterales bacterium]